MRCFSWILPEMPIRCHRYHVLCSNPVYASSKSLHKTSRIQRPMLILSSIILQIFLMHGVDMSSSNTSAIRMELLSDIIVMRSLSVRPGQVPDLDLYRQFSSQPREATAVVQSIQDRDKDQDRRICIPICPRD